MRLVVMLRPEASMGPRLHNRGYGLAVISLGKRICYASSCESVVTYICHLAHHEAGSWRNVALHTNLESARGIWPTSRQITPGCQRTFGLSKARGRFYHVDARGRRSARNHIGVTSWWYRGTKRPSPKWHEWPTHIGPAIGSGN